MSTKLSNVIRPDRVDCPLQKHQNSPHFLRKIKRGQSFATKTSLFMFIQVKDWKNEGQGVAPNCILYARS